ncbi:MAG: hypothetical protein JW912_07500 [Sedimentisphaerales bacterium]|nr:hypothetical protein [Sedimentisphaerales bacterium]
MVATKAKPKTKKATGMTMPQIRQKAKGLGITSGKMSKVDLIHEIQRAEFCTPCYGTTNGYCDQTGCCFMADCLKVRQ